jgi:Protein of unknown function (DUF726)
VNHPVYDMNYETRRLPPVALQQLNTLLLFHVVLVIRTDWLLKFMYRAASVQLSIAGLSAVDWTHRLMHNVDLTHIVSKIACVQLLVV